MERSGKQVFSLYSEMKCRGVPVFLELWAGIDDVEYFTLSHHPSMPPIPPTQHHLHSPATYLLPLGSQIMVEAAVSGRVRGIPETPLSPETLPSPNTLPKPETPPSPETPPRPVTPPSSLVTPPSSLTPLPYYRDPCRNSPQQPTCGLDGTPYTIPY